MIASPSYLSMVPPSSWMMSVIAERYSFSSAVRFCGASAFSEIVVNPWRSEKKIDSSRSSPPSFRRSGWAMICSITVGLRYWLNAPLMNRRCLPSVA